MVSIVNSFRIYTKKCRPIWTITWRECASPSIRSGVPLVQDIDIDYNKKKAKKYIDDYGVDNVIENINTIINHLTTKPENSIHYLVRASWWYSHTIITPEWKAMGYFLAIVKTVLRNNT